MKNNTATLEDGKNVVEAARLSKPAEKNTGEAAATASPVSSNDTVEGNVTTRGDDTATVNDATTETAIDASRPKNS